MKRFKKAAAIRFFPSSCGARNTLPAISDSAAGKPSCGGYTFIPTPSTAYSTAPSSRAKAASVKIPPTFRPRRKISLTHLIWAASPDTVSMAWHAAAAAMVVSRPAWAWPGRSRMLRYTPVSAGEKKLRPRRPPPLRLPDRQHRAAARPRRPQPARARRYW